MERPKLQVALDVLTLPEAVRIANQVAPWADWIEVGTLLIVSEGLHAVRALRQRFPQTTLVADVKVADGARHLASAAFAAGADILSTLSAADDKTIATCVEIAHAGQHKVLGDYLSRTFAPEGLQRLAGLGVDYVGLHLPKDASASASVGAVKAAVSAVSLPVVLAGGVDARLLRQLRGIPLGAVVVGGAIIAAADPAAEAQRIAGLLREW